MYVEVIMALNTPMLFSYVVGSEFRGDIELGSMVTVPLGKSKIYSGIVVEIHNEEVGNRNLKPIVNIVRQKVLSLKQLELWRWIASYYMTTLGDVSNKFLPPSLKMGRKIETQDTIDGFRELCREKSITYYSLSEQYSTLEDIEKLRDSFSRSKAKRKVISLFVSEENERISGITKSKIRENGVSDSVLRDLVNNGILIVSTKREVVKEDENIAALTPLNIPETIDNDILNKIEYSLKSHNTTLLHINSFDSKKEIFISMISNAMGKGGQVLFLTADLQFSNSIIEQLCTNFGDRVVVDGKNRSKLRRHEDYMKILESKEPLLVIGGRASVGLPFQNLSLVVVDNENDPMYGGSEFDLHFNGRDSAIYLAYLHHCKTVIASEFPSFESFFNVTVDKYGYVSSLEKKEAKIMIIDRSNIARKEEVMVTNGIPQKRYISKLIIEQISKRLERGEVSFIYQNRKGFSTVVRCKDCGELVQCKRCNVSLSYQKVGNVMRCRYCGAAHPLISECPSCSSKNIYPQGIGSENVEERLQELFPLARIVRVDGDTLSNVSEFRKIESQIKCGEVDIIVGTIIFASITAPENLSFVGVVNGDNLFSFPDYKTTERAFAVLNQLYNRLSNQHESVMVVQMSKDDALTQKIVRNSHLEIYNSDIKDRKIFCYPPFCKVILFTLRHPDSQKLDAISSQLAQRLRAQFGADVIGAFAPQVDKIRNEYIEQIMVKIRDFSRLSFAKKLAIKEQEMLRREIKISMITY